jgi:hypothetical protein
MLLTTESRGELVGDNFSDDIQLECIEESGVCLGPVPNQEIPT